MISKKINFTDISGMYLSDDTNVVDFQIRVPRKLSYAAALREVKKQYPNKLIVKDIHIFHISKSYTISVEDFIQAASLIK